MNPFFSDFKKAIIEKYGQAAGEAVWSAAENENRRLIREFPDVKGDGKVMYDVAAIYIALRERDPENALSFLCEQSRRLGIKVRYAVRGMTSIPLVPKAIWRALPSFLRSASSPEKGYTRRIVNDTSRLMGLDILSCPLNDAAIAMGVPEAAAIVCAMDKEYLSGLRGIDYKRTMSLAEGGSCCDYRFSYNKFKR